MDDRLDLKAYVQRIGYEGSLKVNEETLTGLHQAHTLAVPFENLDVYYHHPIALDLPSLFKKIVVNRRGGYCFEMNGLFRAVLEQIGFGVTPLLARVSIDFKREFGPKTHQVLMVTLEKKRWLVDVGFGKDGLITPLHLDSPNLQHQFSRSFRLETLDNWSYILDLVTQDHARCQYTFTLEPCTRLDYLMSNHYTSTFPESLFLNHLICTLPTEQGRITLTDTHFKTDKQGEVTLVPVRDEKEFREKLLKIFGLDLARIKASKAVSPNPALTDGSGSSR